MSSDRKNCARRCLGLKGEALAADYLARAGYSILNRNFRRRGGELDIVAKQGQVLVFVEVKTRSGLSCGYPAEAVTPAKRKKIIRAARAFLADWPGPEPLARFDVLEVFWTSRGPEINHLLNAFEAADFDEE